MVLNDNMHLLLCRSVWTAVLYQSRSRENKPAPHHRSDPTAPAAPSTHLHMLAHAHTSAQQLITLTPEGGSGGQLPEQKEVVLIHVTFVLQAFRLLHAAFPRSRSSLFKAPLRYVLGFPRTSQRWYL